MQRYYIRALPLRGAIDVIQLAVLLGVSLRVLPSIAQEHLPDIQSKSDATGRNVASRNWDKWIPSGWTLLNSATGDLSFDGEDDAALVLEKNEPKESTLKQQEQEFETDRRYGTRRLLILVRDKSEFRLAVQTDKFLPSQNIKNDPCSGSSVNGIEIRRNKLFLTLAHEFACGIGAGGDTKFTIQMRENRFRLIGVDATYSTRDDFRTSSRNYLTGEIRATFSRGEGDDSQSCNAINKKLKQQPIHLDDIGTAATYEIRGEPRSRACK